MTQKPLAEAFPPKQVCILLRRWLEDKQPLSETQGPCVELIHKGKIKNPLNI